MNSAIVDPPRVAGAWVGPPGHSSANITTVPAMSSWAWSIRPSGPVMRGSISVAPNAWLQNSIASAHGVATSDAVTGASRSGIGDTAMERWSSRPTGLPTTSGGRCSAAGLARPA